MNSSFGPAVPLDGLGVLPQRVDHLGAVVHERELLQNARDGCKRVARVTHPRPAVWFDITAARRLDRPGTTGRAPRTAWRALRARTAPGAPPRGPG